MKKYFTLFLLCFVLSFSSYGQGGGDVIITSMTPADFSMLQPGQLVTIQYQVEVTPIFGTPGSTIVGCTRADESVLTSDVMGFITNPMSSTSTDGCGSANITDTGDCPGGMDGVSGTVPNSGQTGTLSFTVGNVANGPVTIELDAFFFDGSGCGRATEFIAAAVLPITLENFEARQHEELVELNWTTSMEQNNDYFTLERSFDGKNFFEVATITGAGDSEELLDYSFTDRTATELLGNGTAYYRLSQTDYDGTTNVAKIIQVELTGKNLFDVIRVAQSETDMTLDFVAPTNGTATVDVYDLNGRRLVRNAAAAGEGFNSIVVDKAALTSGLYVLHLTVNNQTLTQKVTVF